MKRDSLCMKGFGIVCGMALVFLAGAGLDADAQGFRGGSRLSAEDAKAAWTLQSASVSKEIGVAKKKAKKVSVAYLTSHENYRKAMQELFESSDDGDRRERFQAFRELQEEERGKLEEALKGILKGEQLAKAMGSLGAFDRQWDGFANTLAGFELEAAKLQKAMSLTIAYVSGTYEARQEAFENQDFQSLREIYGDNKAKLDEGMAKILSAEDQATWVEATTRRGRRGGGN